jgi:hypothetical protein
MPQEAHQTPSHLPDFSLLNLFHALSQNAGRQQRLRLTTREHSTPI